MSTVLEFIIFMIISKFTSIPMEKISGQTLIPLRLQEDIITQVIASTGAYLPLPCEEGLTAGQIVEEVKKALAKKLK